MRRGFELMCRELVLRARELWENLFGSVVFGNVIFAFSFLSLFVFGLGVELEIFTVDRFLVRCFF